MIDPIVELELDKSPIYAAPKVFGGIIAAGGWCAPARELYDPYGDVAFWVKAAKKQRKRAQRAEKKLKKITKLEATYGDMTFDVFMSADLWSDIDAIIDA